MSYLDWPVSRIATEIAGATAIFFQNRINFCCDGDRSLAEVIAAKSLPAQTIVDALASLEQRGEHRIEPGTMATPALIDHILDRYHDVHREQLAELHRLAHRVETVHRQHPLCPLGLADLLASMSEELSNHMLKEEQVLFPMLVRGEQQAEFGPVAAMRAEHEEHLQRIEQIYALTQDVTPHPQACNTWRALYLGLQEFITDLNLHIHIENHVLFARANA